jgi:HSP20 family protein
MAAGPRSGANKDREGRKPQSAVVQNERAPAADELRAKAQRGGTLDNAPCGIIFSVSQTGPYSGAGSVVIRVAEQALPFLPPEGAAFKEGGLAMLTRWDPFAEIARLQDQMLRWGGTGDTSTSTTPRGGFAPPVDIFEDKDAFHLKVELPGLKTNDVHVNVENDVLTIQGERKLEREDNRHGYHRVECSYGSFARSFTLPKTVDGERLEAEMQDGILSVRIPKQPAPEPKRIAIKDGGGGARALKEGKSS